MVKKYSNLKIHKINDKLKNGLYHKDMYNNMEKYFQIQDSLLIKVNLNIQENQR